MECEQLFEHVYRTRFVGISTRILAILSKNQQFIRETICSSISADKKQILVLIQGQVLTSQVLKVNKKSLFRFNLTS